LPGSTRPGRLRPGRSVLPVKLRDRCRSLLSHPFPGYTGSSTPTSQHSHCICPCHLPSSSSKADQAFTCSTLSWTQLDYTSDGQEHQCHNEWRQALEWCQKATEGKSARHVGRNSSSRLNSAGITQGKITAKKPNEL
jgi:hypothetical protein